MAKNENSKEAQAVAPQPLDGESAERFAERVEIEGKLEATKDEAGEAYASFGEAAFMMACADDDLAERLGEAFVAAKEKLADRQALVSRLQELEAKRQSKLESKKKLEQASAAAKEISEETKRLEEEARKAREEAERLAREAQERADALNALLAEGRQKQEDALREVEAARAAAETTMLFEFVGNDEEAAEEGEQVVASADATPEAEIVAPEPAFNPGETVAMSEMAALAEDVEPCADPVAAAISAEPTVAMPAVAANVCPNCGSSVGERDSFCMECGTKLSAAAPAPVVAQPSMCPNCGNLRQEGDAFCMMCGTKF